MQITWNVPFSSFTSVDCRTGALGSEMDEMFHFLSLIQLNGLIWYDSNWFQSPAIGHTNGNCSRSKSWKILVVWVLSKWLAYLFELSVVLNYISGGSGSYKIETFPILNHYTMRPPMFLCPLTTKVFNSCRVICDALVNIDYGEPIFENVFLGWSDLITIKLQNAITTSNSSLLFGASEISQIHLDVDYDLPFLYPRKNIGYIIDYSILGDLRNSSVFEQGYVTQSSLT